MASTVIYCQNCRAPNSTGDSHCSECGTRLLLVVFPSSLQYDTNQTPSYFEDHLLERVSILELRHSQMADAIQGMLDIIREQGAAMRENHELIKELWALISDSPSDDAGPEIEVRTTAADGSPSAKDIPADILAAHEFGNPELLIKLVSEAEKQTAAGNDRLALQLFERASFVSSGNLPLLTRYAFEAYSAEKFDIAAGVAEDALRVGHDPACLIISGLANTENRSPDDARRRLGAIVSDARFGALANVAWGFNSAYDGKWPEAAAAFKQALISEPAPELEYLAGCCYFQLRRLPMANRHFKAAVERDPGFADAWFMKAQCVGSKGGKTARAEALEMAIVAGDANAQCRELLGRKKMVELEVALPFRHFGDPKLPLISGGSFRIRQFVRKLIRDLVISRGGGVA